MNAKEWNAKFIMYRRTIKHLKETVNRDLNPRGISLQHATYLLLLADRGSLKIKQLSELSDNDAALTSRALKLLQDKNMIDRTCESVRKCSVFLTDKGKDVVKYIGECFARVRGEAMKVAGAEGQDALLTAIFG